MSATSDALTRLKSACLDTNVFATEVTFYSQGDLDSPATIVADVSWAHEGGDHSVRGDGSSSLNQGRGRKIRRTCNLEIASSYTFNENGRDLFKLIDVDGSTEVFVTLQRIDGRDETTQTLVCVQGREFAAQPGRRDG